MKRNNKLPYRERVRHAAYRDTYTQRSEEIQIQKEIKRMERDKAQAMNTTQNQRGNSELISELISDASLLLHCPNCGARMKGGAE